MNVADMCVSIASSICVADMCISVAGAQPNKRGYSKGWQTDATPRFVQNYINSTLGIHPMWCEARRGSRNLTRPPVHKYPSTDQPTHLLPFLGDHYTFALF